MKIELEKVAAVAVGGKFIDINVEKEMEYDDSCEVVDDDGNTVTEDDSPVICFTGLDGNRYVVSLNSVDAFRFKP